MNIKIEKPQLSTDDDYHVVKFLIVDDDQVSVMSIKRALKKNNISNPVSVAKDGQEALDILRGATPAGKITPPYLVTLDLNMPRMGGLEFLDVLRDDPDLRRVVVFVLSTSDMPDDVKSAYDRNVAGYIVKNDLQNSLSKAIKMIQDYTNLVVLPA